jgi:Domain of unknown function (DUF4399)
MRMFAIVAALALAASVTAVQSQERSPSPPGAKVYFENLKNGAKVTNPVTVKFGIKGMTLAPAGTKMENSGHHHLLIDTDLPADLSKPLPVVENKIVHFGKAQTETTLTLSPGKHTLQLLLADQNHIPHDPPVFSKKITITVTQ